MSDPREENKNKKPQKRAFKRRGNAASVKCFMGLFSPCWLACQKQNLDCVKQVSMSTTASSHNPAPLCIILASPAGLVDPGRSDPGIIRVFHPMPLGYLLPGIFSASLCFRVSFEVISGYENRINMPSAEHHLVIEHRCIDLS
jgi:hypothetical protein